MIKQNGLEGKFDADGSLTADFLRSLGENVVEVQQDVQGENSQGKGISAAEAKTDFSLKNGVVHIDTDQEIFEGVEKENVGKVVRDYMKQRFRGTTVEDVGFSKISEREYTYSEDSKRLYNKEPDGYDAKMRASTELDNFIRSAKLIGHEDAKHPKNFNTGGYDRYDVQFVLNGNAFSGEMLVANGEKGRQFYDIVNVKNAPHINEVGKQDPELAGMGSAENAVPYSRASDEQTTPSVGSNTLNNSIPQNPDLSTASGEKASGNYDHRFMSPDLWHREGEVRRELARISQDSGENISVVSRELSDEGSKQYGRLKKAFNTLSEISGGKMQMVVVEKNTKFTGAYAQGDTVYISADAIESGKWGEALIEESTHFTQGTAEHGLLRAFLADDAELLAKIESELTKEGNDYGFTAEDAEAFRASLEGEAESGADDARARRYANEVTAHMSAELLSNEAVIDRLVGQHATLAEKILIKFRQLGRAFAKDKALTERVATAEALYIKAIERRGWQYVDGKIVGASEEELDSDEKIYYNKKQNFERGGVTDGTEQIKQNDIGQAGTDRADAAGDARTQSEAGDGRGVPQEGRNFPKEAYDIRERRRELSQKEKCFAEDSFVAPRAGSVEAEAIGTLTKYNIEAYVVKESVWDRKAPATSKDGRVYIKEGIDETYRGLVASHEATHVMKQLRFQPYMDFIMRTPDMLNIADEYALYIIEETAKHRKLDVFHMDEFQQIALYDEINATVYGHYAAGHVDIYFKEDFNSAFYDFDAYISELDAIHEQFKAANADSKANKQQSNDEIYYSRKSSANQQTTDDSSGDQPKQKSKTKADMLKDNAELREKKRAAEKRAEERDDRAKLGERIGQRVQTLKRKQNRTRNSRPIFILIPQSACRPQRERPRADTLPAQRPYSPRDR